MYETQYIVEHLCDSGKVLLLHMVSGQIVEKTKETEKVLELVKAGKGEEASSRYAEETRILKDKKFLFGDGDEERAYVNGILEQAYAHNLKSWTFFLHLTYDCNLSCTYCNYKDIPKERKFMSLEGLEHAFQVMHKVTENEECTDVTVVLFGGEPFLPDNRKVMERFFVSYREFSDWNKRKNIQTNLIAFSNGVEIGNNRTLLWNNHDILSAVYVTVNGPDFIHNKTRKFPDGEGSYEQAVEGVCRLLEWEIPTWLVTNVNRENMEYLPYIHGLIEEKGWNQSEYFLGCCVSRIKNRFERDDSCLPEHEFLDLVAEMKMSGKLELKYFNFEDMRILKNIMALFHPEAAGTEAGGLRNYCIYGCGNRINQYTFSADGYIYPCAASAGNLKYAIGQFRLKEEICLAEEPGECWTKKTVLEKNRCRQCKTAFVCGGGCPLESREKNKFWDIPFCPEAEKIVHSYFRCLERGIPVLNRETVYESGGNACILPNTL